MTILAHEGFHTPEEIRSYMLAGKATITLESKKTGKHLTFKVTQATDKETGAAKDLFFVGLLTGPDNYRDYQYLGMIAGTTNGSLAGNFRLTKASKFSEDAPAYKAFQYLLRNIDADRMAGDMVTHHEGQCGRCGRKLTVPASIQRGIGPECAGMMGLV